MLAGGLEKSIEKSVRSSNPSATATVISIDGTPASGRRLAAADVAFEVSLPQYIEEGEEPPTADEAGAMADSAFAALSEAVAAPDFATVLSESMEEAAHQLVESGVVEEAEMAALVASVDVVVEETAIAPQDVILGEVHTFEPSQGNGEDDYGDVGNFDWMQGAAASCRGGLWAWGLVFVVAAL